jgi:hypothetical protein
MSWLKSMLGGGAPKGSPIKQAPEFEDDEEEQQQEQRAAAAAASASTSAAASSSASGSSKAPRHSGGGSSLQFAPPRPQSVGAASSWSLPSGALDGGSEAARAVVSLYMQSTGQPMQLKFEKCLLLLVKQGTITWMPAPHAP